MNTGLGYCHLRGASTGIINPLNSEPPILSDTNFKCRKDSKAERIALYHSMGGLEAGQKKIKILGSFIIYRLIYIKP
ncbi:MAG: hypothetical protein RL189_785 [Pseudomonadota bacterium]|jgi:hypothetical protein